MGINKNTTSFDELYMQYHRMVYGISLSILHSEEAAKDITQEVFMRLYQWRDRINDENKIRGWLSVTARNMSINALRVYRHEEELHDTYAKNSNPEDIFIASEEHRRIHTALGKLKESYVEILTLRYALNFSVREIAVAINIPSASVYTRLHRAEKALERVLGVKEAEQ